MLNEFAVAIKALIVNNNKYLILTKTKEEAIYDKSPELFDLPGGRIEYGESLEDALKREIFEETGITKFEIDRIVSASSFIRYDGLQLTIITYLVRIDEIVIMLSDEHCSYQWIEEGEMDLPEWIIDTIKASNNQGNKKD